MIPLGPSIRRCTILFFGGDGRCMHSLLRNWAFPSPFPPKTFFFISRRGVRGNVTEFPVAEGLVSFSPFWQNFILLSRTRRRPFLSTPKKKRELCLFLDESNGSLLSFPDRLAFARSQGLSLLPFNVADRRSSPFLTTVNSDFSHLLPKRTSLFFLAGPSRK